MEGAQPLSWAGGPHGALVLHGITGTPASVRALAATLAAAGLAVEAPVLPGHGTTVDDLAGVGWVDWVGAVEEAYAGLAGRCGRVVVAGLSMGGTLACRLAADHPEVAGLVCINPYIDPPAESFLALLRDWLAHGSTMLPAIGADIARPGGREPAYPQLPVAPMLSLLEAVVELEASLPRIACPLLLCTSAVDHVVPPRSSDVLADRVSGPVRRVLLERSFHVATLDHDAELIERRAAAFAAEVTGASAVSRETADEVPLATPWPHKPAGQQLGPAAADP